MKKWAPLFLGVLVGALLSRGLGVEDAHACDPACPADEAVVLHVEAVDGSEEAQELWTSDAINDALITPNYLLIATDEPEGQVELGYSR